MQAASPSGSDSRLILILSSERSGSTLTRVILGEHSRIVSPQELFLMRYPDYASWRRQKSVAVESLVEYFRILGTPKSVEEIDAACAGLTTLEVYRWMAGFRPPGAFLLDKTPAYANDGETLRRSLDLDPFYIWLIRHPLGVIESHVRIKREARRAPGWQGLRRRLRDAAVQYGSLAHRGMTPLARQREIKWVVQQTIIREFLAGIADARQCTIRFERLVSDPAATVERLCRALGIAVEPAMLEVCGERRTMNVNLGDPNFHKHDRIDPGMADGWRRVFREDSLTLETRRLMEALGIGAERDWVTRTGD
jgi:LPS sulfotransferase NodH